MADRFFARFNLHNSVGRFPMSVDILAPLLNCEKAKLQRELDDFETIQRERVIRLKQSHAQEIAKLFGKKVLFLGDSITSDNLGYRTTVTGVANLESFDESISGGTSSMLLHSAKSQIEKRNPDIVSLMIGANDSVSIGKDSINQVSIQEYARNVQEIIGWAKQGGATVLLFEITPIHEKRFAASFNKESKFQTNQMINRYNMILKEIANSNEIRLISHDWITVFDDYDSLFEPDGIHLSIIGQELFAKKWLTAAAKVTYERKRI